MNPDMLEILIGKRIDSEITPAEERLLEKELKSNTDARILFHQLQQLDRLSKQTLTQEILDQGASFETIFQRAAAQHHPTKVRRRNIRWTSLFRAAGSLAAGFLLGMGALHFYRKPEAAIPSRHSSEPIVAKNDRAVAAEPIPPKDAPAISGPRLIHPHPNQLDWYTYTDPSGTQWMIESPRSDGAIGLASYSGDL